MSKRNHDEMDSWSLPTKMAGLYESELYSDLIIKCKNREFKVHRNIVLLQSEPMEMLIQNHSKEGQSGVIDFSEDDVELVEMMVKFLYTGDLAMILPINNSVRAQGLRKLETPGGPGCAAKQGNNSEGRDPEKLIQAVKLYFMADRLFLPKLKDLAASQYLISLYHGWKSLEFTTSIRLIFENTMDTDRCLRDVAINCAALHARKLLNRKDFVALFTDKPDIAVQIFKRAVKEMKIESQGCPWLGLEHAVDANITRRRPGAGKQWYCRFCQKDFNEEDLDADLIA